jgi:hypothetical protein
VSVAPTSLVAQSSGWCVLRQRVTDILISHSRSKKKLLRD